jgi:diguanylate cyclase (GGDEF)-like protein
MPRLSAWWSWGFVAVGGGAIVVYPVCPPPAQLLLFLLVEVAALSATVCGALRPVGRAERRPWWAIAACTACFVGATFVRILVPGASPMDPPTDRLFIPDVLVVPGYLLLGYAMLTFLGRRRAAQDDPARADALLVGLAATSATWAFLIAPRFSDHVPALPVLSAAVFPMADVALLAMVTQLLIADGIRAASLWLFGLSLTGVFVGDLLYAMQIDKLGPSSVAGIIDVSFLVGFVAMGGAALHPSMRTLTDPQPVQVRRMTALRAIGLGLVTVGPMCVAILFPVRALWNQIVEIVLLSLTAFMVLLRIASNQNHRHRAEEVARHRATHDALTNLPNRELLTETLTEWYARPRIEGTEFSLLFLDLDRFKAVNDRLGHAVGVELLVAVGERLRGAVRADDLVCRIGADEYVIAMASPSHRELAESLAGRVVDLFEHPFDETEVSMPPLTVTVSVGIARSTDAMDAIELIREAETAMYRVKDAGRNGYTGFAPPMRDLVRRHADLTQAMNSSLAGGELLVVFQPIIDLADDHVTGFEALMRWHSPLLGQISPLEFIPIAEDTGFIVKAGAWLLEEALSHLAVWCRSRPDTAPPLHMSINVSARQLRRSDNFIGNVRRILDRTGLPPTALWLELTESATLDDAEVSRGMLRELVELGTTLCLDDFGTGYSSLTYLKDFPAAIVKIDRSFVSGIGTKADGEVSDDETIVQTVITVAHQLGRRVVAEGVETTRQRDWLRDRGCDLVQGYLYGRPEPAEVARDLVVEDHESNLYTG